MGSYDEDLNLDLNPIQKKSSAKKWILLGSLVALLILVVVLSAIFVKKYYFGAPQSTTAVVEKPKGPQKAIYASLDEDIIAVINDDSGSKHHIDVAITVLSRDEAIESAVKKHQPLIVNDLLALFGTQEYRLLQDPKAKSELRDKATKVVKAIIKEQTGNDIVESILFTKFIMD